jgi:hypothetical protein
LFLCPVVDDDDPLRASGTEDEEVVSSEQATEWSQAMEEGDVMVLLEVNNALSEKSTKQKVSSIRQN